MSSSSKSSTSSTQNYSSVTQDNRVVADAGALVFSQADGNTINSTSNDNSTTTTVYNSLDAGAVGSSYDFAEKVTRGAADLSVASVGAVTDFGVDALKAVKDAYAGSAAASAAANAAALGAVNGAMGDVKDIARWGMDNSVDLAGKAMSQTATAWGKSFDGLADNTKMSISAITSANKDANDQIRNANKDVADAYKGVTDTLSDAWKSSKAGEQKMLAFGMLAIVGLAAAKVLGGR